jgi:hypothetical protein
MVADRWSLVKGNSLPRFWVLNSAEHAAGSEEPEVRARQRRNLRTTEVGIGNWKYGIVE